jgi:glycosyltransferase involved in cell wall biosynthesis
MIGNNGTPTDRRVWLECTALREAGFAVSVVSPARDDQPPRECLDGIDIYRYRTTQRGGRGRRFVLSFAASWVQTARLALSIWRRHPFQVIQACNPPDTYFPLALLFRPFGVRFVFDQHDLCPEIYYDRFAEPSRLVHRILLLLERWTHRVADHVITVNESCKELLVSRTATPPEQITVVRTGPDFARLRLAGREPDLKRGRRYLCAYLGVMGPQDGVDLVLRAIDRIVHDLERDDIHFILLGDGQCLGDLKRLAAELQIEPWVDFTGWADDRLISSVLSTADLGLQPDRRTPFTELCTMLKTVEYLAFGLPVVTFDLIETRRTAAGAAAYVAEETTAAFAATIIRVLDAPERRAAMSALALRRARTELSWEGQREIYVDVIKALVGAPVADRPQQQEIPRRDDMTYRRRTRTRRPDNTREAHS